MYIIYIHTTCMLYHNVYYAIILYVYVQYFYISIFISLYVYVQLLYAWLGSVYHDTYCCYMSRDKLVRFRDEKKETLTVLDRNYI